MIRGARHVSDEARALIRSLALQHRVNRPRLVTSAADWADGQAAELSILVEPQDDTTLFDLGGLQDALEDALRVKVRVWTPPELPAFSRVEMLRGAELV